MKTRIGTFILAVALGVLGAQISPQALMQPAPAPTYYQLADIGGTLIFVIPPTGAATTAPSATPTRTPSPTPSRTPTLVTPALPTHTPVVVTPLATPQYPRYTKAEIDYIPRVRLIIRTSPEKLPGNATGAYAEAGTRYMIYHLREYAFEGAIWGCKQDTAPTLCREWFAIQADLSPIDGVLEIYADPAPASD